ncbi:uncharacterized protein LOC124444641 [Xenia sp. Carnegie-2017]|uniref:uncharacterized protein LOC124444641 n=1 Tax=Xenia sp. Carnegie-2017 TaxID=2897299 RepID=UPI001F037000|nr:uncharacterized protein LOC124444641 [Xenia sp. Carnegie-2017]
MSLEDMLLKFNIMFSWECRGNLRSILPQVVNICTDVDHRSLEQIMDGFYHQSCPGLLFYRPNNFDIVSTFKLNFTNNLPHANLCVTTIVVLSEARNLELYVNGEYEKSVKGRRRMNEEKKSSLYEAQFDLSNHVKRNSDVEIKFLSYPSKDQVRLQAIVMELKQYDLIGSKHDLEQISGPFDLSSVKQYLGSVGRPLSQEAQNMLNTIENFQKSPAFKAQQLLSFKPSNFKNIVENFKKANEKEVRQKAVLAGEALPQENERFQNMLSKLTLNEDRNDERVPCLNKDEALTLHFKSTCNSFPSSQTPQ